MDINWDEAPDGATHYMPVSEIFCEAWIKDADHNSYSYIVVGDDNQEWGTARFAQPKAALSCLVGVPKPVFTKAMSDAGELPSVGMEVVARYNYDSRLVTHQGTVLYTSKNHIILNTINGNEWHGLLCDYVIEPLPTSIQLVDGKAYQFDYHSGRGVHGIYHKPNEDGFAIFKFTGGAINKELVSNIKPLTVESDK